MTRPTVNEPAAKPTAPSRALIALVRGYQAARFGRPSPCRYLPSCSAYACDALSAHGAIRGTALAVRRIARCRPGGGSGVDLVPEMLDTSSSKGRRG